MSPLPGWLGGPGDRPEPVQTEVPSNRLSLHWIDSQPDPWESLVHAYSYGEWGKSRLPLGAIRRENGDIELAHGSPQSNVAIIGPPRSAKTTGILAPMAIAHNGPAVILSSKPDLARMTAVARSRFGPVWHFDATGDDPILGLIPARWSPVSEAKTWTEAQRIGKAIASSTGGIGDSRSSFWARQAGKMIAVALFAANLGGRDMYLVTRVLLEDAAANDEMEAILESNGAMAQMALDKWRSLLAVHAEGISSIRMTANDALDIYNRPEVLMATEHPNFSLVDFVRGEPDVFNESAANFSAAQLYKTVGVTTRDGWPNIGKHATVYVTATSEDAEDAASIYRGFVRQLWSTVQRQHRADQRDGVTNRRPTLLLVDELANISPDASFPSMVSQSADQGMLIASGIQDLAQIERHFGSEAKTFLTVHREIIVFPNIKNPETLHNISDILGYHWETRTTSGDSESKGTSHSTGTSKSESDHRVPNMDPGMVRDGNPEDPKAALLIPATGSFGWIWPTPIWGAQPWPRALIACLERQSENHMVAPDGTYWPINEMPVPDLGRIDPEKNRTYLELAHRDGAQLYARWLAIKKEYDDAAASVKARRS